MRIIALQGKHNSGKTTTLKKLIKFIHLSADGFVFGDVNPRRDVPELCGKEEGDMQYWCTCGGVKIGITTRGDARRYLQADFFTKRKNFGDRDIVVCAIRSSGGTVDFVNQQDTVGPIVCEKRLVADAAGKEQQEKVNAEQAKELFDKLKKLVEEIEVEK